LHFIIRLTDETMVNNTVYFKTPKGSKVYSNEIESESATPKGSNNHFPPDSSINLKSLPCSAEASRRRCGIFNSRHSRHSKLQTPSTPGTPNSNYSNHYSAVPAGILLPMLKTPTFFIDFHTRAQKRASWFLISKVSRRIKSRRYKNLNFESTPKNLFLSLWE